MMQISPKGIHVVCFLADSRHATNESALQTWVEDQLDDPAFNDDAAISGELDLLLVRLRATLDGLEARNDF